MKHFNVLIVGGGHGGAQSASALRQHKFEGSVAILDEGSESPYERPPLSKGYLAGEKAFDRILLRSPAFWQAQGIEHLPNECVTAVDPIARRVSSASGTVFSFDKLIWAAGGHARGLSCTGHNLKGVHSIRTRADVDQLRADLASSGKVVIVGGGYIGLEAAAVLTKLGKHVTVLEALDRVLARVAGEPLSRFYEAEHRSRGVDIRLGAMVECIQEGLDGRASGVRLADGEVLPADLVVVGVGVIPSVQPLQDAGAKGDHGVRVDAFARTTLADIYAVGDCAIHDHPYFVDGPLRLESVQNANDMAITAVDDILGRGRPYSALPWFWSNQYDLRLQTVGLSTGSDKAIVRGEPAQRSFSVVYLKAGKVVALDCVNATRDYVQGRDLVQQGVQIEAAVLADATRPLKEVLARWSEEASAKVAPVAAGVGLPG